MKKLYLAIAILLILPAMIFISQFYLKSATAQMTDMINQAEDSVSKKNDAKAKQNLELFEQEWEKSNKIIATFVRHSELDTVNASEARLLPYLEDQDYTNFRAECEVIKAQFHHIMHTEEFSIDNVF